MQKIILYYKFAPLPDPEAIQLWQRSLCDKHGLKGRILISSQGINGTLGGEVSGLKAYVQELKKYAAFKDTKFKWSDGGADNFPKLSVKVRSEIVTFGATDEITVDTEGIVGGGKHLTPEAVHRLVAERGDEVVFFDGRNEHEAAIGKFKNAVVPAVKHTRDFIAELESDKYDAIKDKPVVTYCTGGIRCEVLSVLMKNRGFSEVYQIDGGIANYGAAYGDAGLWEGALYVFDERLATTFSDRSIDIGHCGFCSASTSSYRNCMNQTCNKQMLVCQSCSAKTVCANCSGAIVSSHE